MTFRHRTLAAALSAALAAGIAAITGTTLADEKTQKPPLHAKHWLAITGRPIAATAGAMMFQQGGNAIDAACAMLGATSTMWDVLSWGGETQAIIYNPETDEVIGVNALGVAPTGATPEFFLDQEMDNIPGFGPLAAVTPGTPGGLMMMLAEYGRLSLAEVLAPSIRLADGYPMEAETGNRIENNKERLREWPYSREVMLPNEGEAREAPRPGQIFRQPDLANTLRKLVEAEAEALDNGASREEAIMAAHRRFYEGDIAEEFVRAVQAQGGLITMEDMANWRPRFEPTRAVSYRGVEVHKLDHWTQGPVMLQALNILENFDLKAMGYNSARYIHTLYQAMSLAFADRDFYYGDPKQDVTTPMEGLLSKDYARARADAMDLDANDPDPRPGNPYDYQDGEHPYPELLEAWRTVRPDSDDEPRRRGGNVLDGDFEAGTTSVIAADADGWMVSMTPSGGWVPAVIAGRTGIGMSQRMQSFVLDPRDNPYNVVAPGRQPRVTLTPSLAMKDGRPWLAFAKQGGDFQDQGLLQFFLNRLEFGMDVQEATEAANVFSYQQRASFGEQESRPGEMIIRRDVPPWIVKDLKSRGYDITVWPRTSGPINAIEFDHEEGTIRGGASNYGEDHGVAW